MHHDAYKAILLNQKSVESDLDETKVVLPDILNFLLKTILVSNNKAGPLKYVRNWLLHSLRVQVDEHTAYEKYSKQE